MCVGVTIIFGTPAVGACFYYVWNMGRDSVMSWARISTVPQATALSAGAGATAVLGSYQMQRRILLPLFDEGGALSMNWKQGAESLGEPLQLKTWGQFYRALGPPVFARLGAMTVAFYVGGAAHTFVAHRRSDPAKPTTVLRGSPGRR